MTGSLRLCIQYIRNEPLYLEAYLFICNPENSQPIIERNQGILVITEAAKYFVLRSKDQ